MMKEMSQCNSPAFPFHNSPNTGPNKLQGKEPKERRQSARKTSSSSSSSSSSSRLRAELSPSENVLPHTSKKPTNHLVSKSESMVECTVLNPLSPGQYTKMLSAQPDIEADASGDESAAVKMPLPSPSAAITNTTTTSRSIANTESVPPRDDSDMDSDNEGGSHPTKGRFSKAEKKILFSIIREDQDLLRSFLHQLKRRIWDGKSWMNEIANRFNERCKTKRSHDAVRHHLKLRRHQASQSITPEEQENQDFINLLDHAENCSKKDACTRCLQLNRLRVKRGYASCGHRACDICDHSLPFVLDPFDASRLKSSVLDGIDMRRMRRQTPVSNPSPPAPVALPSLLGSHSRGNYLNDLSAALAQGIYSPFQLHQFPLTLGSPAHSPLSPGLPTPSPTSVGPLDWSVSPQNSSLNRSILGKRNAPSPSEADRALLLQLLLQNQLAARVAANERTSSGSSSHSEPPLKRPHLP